GRMGVLCWKVGRAVIFAPEGIQARLREKPFRPVRIVVSEGLRYDIFHPDLVLVGWNDLMIGFPRPEGPPIYDRVVRIAIGHVVGLEDIPVPATGSANGPGQTAVRLHLRL